MTITAATPTDDFDARLDELERKLRADLKRMGVRAPASAARSGRAERDERTAERDALNSDLDRRMGLDALSTGVIRAGSRMTFGLQRAPLPSVPDRVKHNPPPSRTPAQRDLDDLGQRMGLAERIVPNRTEEQRELDRRMGITPKGSSVTRVGSSVFFSNIG